MPLYQITYSPLVSVETKAFARGMKEGDGTSFWDWVSDEECTVEDGRFLDFRQAVAHAVKCADLDVCGEVRVEEIVRVHWRGAPPSTECVSTWLIYPETPVGEPKPDEPDYRGELSLGDGDEVCAA